jgi:hypothetical protein
MGFNLAPRYDPLAVFSQSKTPVGLYARKRWLQERSTTWEQDFRKTVASLVAGQGRDGSWNGSIVKSVRCLFWLHLTVREPNKAIDRCLDWLVEKSRRVFTKRHGSLGEPITNRLLKGLPFTEGCGAFFLSGATLFLATIFGRQKDPRILSVYKRLEELGKAGQGRWCGWSCSNNIFRAFVVHPEYTEADSVALAVRAFGNAQERSGRWRRPVPFYQTINALAHLNSKEADAQLEKAFEWLFKTQNRDGTWGRSDREWKTFLVVHAMKNKGVL